MFSPSLCFPFLLPAGDPSTNANFCQSCICTVASNYVPATLTAAGILTSTTSPTAAEEIIGSCAPSSHVALLKLGALTEDWSEALNTKCDDDASIAKLSCQQYAPKSLPTKKAVRKEAGPVTEGDSCPFQAEDIRTEELASARKACGESGNKTVLLMSAGELPALLCWQEGGLEQRFLGHNMQHSKLGPNSRYQSCRR